MTLSFGSRLIRGCFLARGLGGEAARDEVDVEGRRLSGFQSLSGSDFTLDGLVGVRFGVDLITFGIVCCRLSAELCTKARRSD